jgi:hypothetical protein
MKMKAALTARGQHEGAPPSPGEGSQGRVGRRGRWRRRLIVTAVLVAALVLFHAPLFRFLAGFLVVNDPLATTDAVIVMGSSGPFQAPSFQEAARLYREGYAEEIVLIEDRSSRLAKAGIVPTLETLGRRELAGQDVPEQALTVLTGDYRTAWDGARRLRAWLDEHPGASATVLCSEFASRGICGIGNQVLGAEAARVRWRALPDRRYGVSTWWKSRQGIVQFAGAYIALAHTRVFGEPPAAADHWDPDEYEQRLRKAADQ